MNNFKNFTNLYEVSKTLRMKLEPVGSTEDLLKSEGIIEVDEVRRENYEKVRTYFNKLHLDFIQKSLGNMETIDFEQYFLMYKEWKKDTKNKKTTKIKEKGETKLMEEIENIFDIQTKKYLESYPQIYFKKKDKSFLYELGVFELLKDKYGDDEDTVYTNEETGEVLSIFDNWKGWLLYWEKYFSTRKNLYKSDGTSTAIASRIIKDNLRIFIDNLENYRKIQNDIQFENTDIEQDFSVDIEKYFTLDHYNTCFLQEGIDLYNTVIGGETLESGKKLVGLNEYINKYRQKTGNKIPYFKKLQKQILSEVHHSSFIEQIESEEAFIEVLKRFFTESNTRVKYIQHTFENIKNFSDKEYQKIYINKIAYNTIIHKFFGEVGVFEKYLFQCMKQEKSEGISYKKSESKYSFPDFISLYFIKSAIDRYEQDEFLWKERYYLDPEKTGGIIEKENKNGWEQFCNILNFELKNILQKEIITPTGEKKEVGYEIYKQKLGDKLQKENFELSETNKALIKDFADSARVLYLFGKYFVIEKKRDWDEKIELSADFYEGEAGYKKKFYDNAYEEIIKPYNLMRNFIAKKPWEENKKWKINFENSSLMKGWDINKESNYYSIIFKEDEKYLLGIFRNSKTFHDIDKFSGSKCKGETVQKMIYKYARDISQNIPKWTTQTKGVIQHFENSTEDYILTKGSSVGNFLQPLSISKAVFDVNNKVYLKNNLEISEMRQNLEKKEEKNYIKSFQKEFLTLGGDEKIYRNSLNLWMDFCKQVVKSYPSCAYFDFSNIKENSHYHYLDEFYTDLDKRTYVLNFSDVSKKYVYDKVENGELYLFEITNKDLQNKNQTTNKNLHTLYFENLFSLENKLHDFVFKLDGNAEIFFRPKTTKEKLGMKKDKSGKEVINHKRYSQNSLFFHFPITINRGTGKLSQIDMNAKLNTFLAYNPDINIIGVDRGEKHLAYYSVINQQSEIIESGTLNHIENLDKNGNPIMRPKKKIVEIYDDEGNIKDYELQETGEEVSYTDYAQLLELKEKKRKLQRQSWKEVEQIKDLKKGYISVVVRKLADLVIQHNAIIVFEDLNMRFKQIRGGIEKSVYQQLEKALIDKLNLLVQKNEMDSEKAGNLLKAYQLTAPIETFKDMGKQTGIIFYTQASYTSKIDPVSGWRPNLYLKKQNAEKNKENILKFDSIIFNAEKGRFEISYDLKKFIQSEKAQFPTKTKWTVCSSVERFRWNRHLNNNKGGYDHYENLTDGKIGNRVLKENEVGNFKDLFKKYNIDIPQNILEQIEALDIKGNEKFFSDFLFLFSLVCQIRNTDDKKSGNDNDFILSPVEPFFDSRKGEDFGEHLPKNGDDNGAYNIARKGLILLERIDTWSDNEKQKYPDLFVSNRDWDEFVGRKSTF